MLNFYGSLVEKKLIAETRLFSTVGSRSLYHLHENREKEREREREFSVDGSAKIAIKLKLMDLVGCVVTTLQNPCI